MKNRVDDQMDHNHMRAPAMIVTRLLRPENTGWRDLARRHAKRIIAQLIFWVFASVVAFFWIGLSVGVYNVAGTFGIPVLVLDYLIRIRPSLWDKVVEQPTKRRIRQCLSDGQNEVSSEELPHMMICPGSGELAKPPTQDSDQECHYCGKTGVISENKIGDHVIRPIRVGMQIVSCDPLLASVLTREKANRSVNPTRAVRFTPQQATITNKSIQDRTSETTPEFEPERAPVL